MLDSLLGRKFTAKCKQYTKRVNSRVAIIRKKKEAMIGFLKNDIAHLLANGHESNAFERMDGLVFEMNQVSCYNMIEQYSQSIRAQLPLLQKQRDCPKESMEAVATLIFAAARFSDLPELCNLRHAFTARYGGSMESSENQEFVEKVITKSFSKDMKLRIMQDIAKEFSVAWNHKFFGQEKPIPSSNNQSEEVGMATKGRDFATSPGQGVLTHMDRLLAPEPLASRYYSESPRILLNKNQSTEKDQTSSWKQAENVHVNAASKTDESYASNKHQARNLKATLNDNTGRKALYSRDNSDTKHEVHLDTRQVKRISQSNNAASVEPVKRIGRKAIDEPENVKPAADESTFSSHMKLRSIEKLSYTEDQHEMNASRRSTPRAKEDLHHCKSGNASAQRQQKCEKLKNMEPPYVIKPNGYRNSACVEEHSQNASTCFVSSSPQKPFASFSARIGESETNFTLAHEIKEVSDYEKSTARIQKCKSDHFSSLNSKQDIYHAAQEKKPLGSGRLDDDTIPHRGPPYMKSKEHKSAGCMEGCHHTVSFDRSKYQHELDSAVFEKPEIREDKYADINATTKIRSHIQSEASTKGKQMAKACNSDLVVPQGNIAKHPNFMVNDDRGVPKCDPSRERKMVRKGMSGLECVYTKNESNLGTKRDSEFDDWNPGWDSGRRKHTEVVEHDDVALGNCTSKFNKPIAAHGVDLPKHSSANKRASERRYVGRNYATLPEFPDIAERNGFYGDYDYDIDHYENGDFSSRNRTRLNKVWEGSSSRQHLKMHTSASNKGPVQLERSSPKIIGSRRHHERQRSCVTAEEDSYDPEEIDLDRLLIRYSSKGDVGQVGKSRVRPQHQPLNYSAEVGDAKAHRSNDRELIHPHMRVPSAPPEILNPAYDVKAPLHTAAMEGNVFSRNGRVARPYFP